MIIFNQFETMSSLIYLRANQGYKKLYQNIFCKIHYCIQSLNKFFHYKIWSCDIFSHSTSYHEFFSVTWAYVQNRGLRTYK